MTCVAIARKEYREVRRSKVLWGLLAAVTGLLVIPILTQSGNVPNSDFTPVEAALSSLMTLSTFLLPLVLLVTSYNSITDELESGSVTYLLGLPNTRRDVIVGKFIGRMVAVSLGIGIAFGIGAILLVVQFGTLPFKTYLAVLALTLSFTAVWVSLGIGISAFAGNRGQALVGALGAYLLLVLAWIFPLLFDPRTLTAYVIESVLGLGAMPEMYDLAYRLSPATAYVVVGGNFMGSGDPTRIFTQDWGVILILLSWIVCPLTIGYLRFRNSELVS